MIEYGFIENGYLRVKALEPITFQNKNPETGELETKVITVEDQIKDLPPGWKPLDRIDDEKIRQAEDGYMVSAIPYDAGDRISYHYEVMPDFQAMRVKIADLKAQLTDSDYKVIKCHEALLIGAPMPYDVVELHTSRQEIRDKINALETIQENMMNI
ncbi:hypothetical protein C5O23_05455 [Duncaniella muris]|uniref:Uncharacterized protein n=1 Tax=Duncaniella muris TaxID=2094150 RepID=A0A2V1IKV1_9BACT|nr:hypothetical protein [Duncaniella muris]PWB02873.1 hypothetical protein C5O23_05455 [Duncaniella muris]